MMRNLYEEKSANFPRLSTDVFFSDYENVYKYNNFINESFNYIQDFQLLKPDLWKRFVQQFRENADSVKPTWRGEFWGKMMRGACLVYSYTNNDELYNVLCQTVSDMLSTQDDYGRISTYSIEREFGGWDIWCRKYVLLGMQYFIEICKEEKLKQRIIQSMCEQMDYIMEKIGDGEGKLAITLATRHWRGLNSSSLLEPVVRLYSITQIKKYLDFAGYIVSSGGTDVVNIFELAYKDEFYPYQYPVTKAYEMTSCFEGLLEYYRVTHEEKYKTAIINYANKILESDFTVIGGSGCSHEMFDHSTVRQANTNNCRVMQETCVTVTLMKFFYQLNLLTGNPIYADAFERSLYNAYLGSINTEKIIEPSLIKDHPDWNIEPLPFDSYSPLTAGTRGKDIGGLLVMSDKHYYGCCACIGSAGIGLVPKIHLLSTRKGFTMNLFIDGTVNTRTPIGTAVRITTETEYPKCGKITVRVNPEKEERFEILIRNPQWSKTTQVLVNGEELQCTEGYISVSKTWKRNDVIEIDVDMRTEAIYPIPYGSQILMNGIVWGHNYVIPTFDREDPKAKNHIALRRGPIMLAQDSRLGYDIDEQVQVKVNSDSYVETDIPNEDTASYPHIVEVRIPLKTGKYMTLTDYASAGKLWTQQSKMAVWLLTK